MEYYRRSAQSGGIVKGIFAFLIFLFIIGAIILGGAAYQYDHEINRPNDFEGDRVIWVKSGMGVNSITAMLVNDGLIEEELWFKLSVYLRSEQSNLQAGEYLIPEASSVTEIIDILVDGKPYLHNITFPEGIITKDVLKLLTENEALDGDITLMPKEGELLPETYSFARGDKRDDIIRRMQAAQISLIDKLWEMRAEDLPFNTKEQAIILASIVEKETGLASERPQVASVFVNRLRKGMRLESDPTIIYGITGGEPLGRGIRLSEKWGETPYNTYVIRGLPPTPIANPGRDAIAAVLNPAETDYIFFVADGTGGHAFAKTLREHNQNVQKWRQIERERNK